MKAAGWTARHRRQSGRLLVVSTAAAALVIAGLVSGLAAAFQPGARAGPAVAPGAGSQTVVPGGSGSRAAARSLARSRDRATAAARRPTARTTRANSTAAALAGRIRPGVNYHGVATFYSTGYGIGACMFGPPRSLMLAAMNAAGYDTARACGAYLLVRAASGASVTVMITDECPPCAPGQLDLSRQAFARLASPVAGRIKITWTLLSPAMTSTISIRYKTDSSRWWCGIQVIGHRNPVALLAVRASGVWHDLPRTSYNYFISAHGSGCGGPIRITDIYGQQLTVNDVALLPNRAQPTGVQFARH